MENNFTIDEVRDFWDSVIDDYEDVNEKLSSTYNQRFTEAIKHLDIQPGMKVLNIWSRTGKAIQYLRKAYDDFELINLEVAPKFIAKSKGNFPRENFNQTNLESLNFSDNYFDRILSLETLEHTPKPIVFLKELNRVLKPQGKLIMSLPPRTAEVSLRIYETFFHNHGEGPHKFLSSKTVKKLLKESGFNLILHKGTLLVPVGPKFIKKFGEKLIDKFQNTSISELGIRQFYICQSQ